MRQPSWLGMVLLFFLLPAAAAGRASRLERINHRLAGHLVDHTRNHGADRRIWSAALGQRRDLYVYLPPGFDPCQRYPLLLWLHGINQDEQAFIREGALDRFDAAMAAGSLPPFLIAIPDGSLCGRRTLFRANPLFLNSAAGNFEDFLIQDVWSFLLAHYPIRPERQAHVLGGFSGGGGAAIRLAIKYRPVFGVAFGVLPPVNLRYVDCHGNYRAPFDPCCTGYRMDVRGREVIARFYGVVAVRLRRMVFPLYGRGPEAVAQLSRVNPIEMLERCQVRPGELALYIGYGGRDQFNIDAQVESFLYRARQRGLTVGVGYDARGQHNWPTALRLLPGVFEWLGPRLAPHSPPGDCLAKSCWKK